MREDHLAAAPVEDARQPGPFVVVADQFGMEHKIAGNLS